MVKDIVCGMGVEEDGPGTFTHRFRGEKFFFCSVECMLLFMKDSLFYIERSLSTVATTQDLVCGMEVDLENPCFTTEYKEKTYYFCSSSCRLLFESEPEEYITRIRPEDTR